MTLLSLAHLILEIALAPVAFLASRREKALRPLAAFAAFLAASDVLRQLLRPVFVHAHRPLVGGVRVLAHLDEALFFGWYAVLAAVAIFYFLRMRPLLVLAGWVAAWVWCLNYPYVSGVRLRNVYHLATLVGASLMWVAILGGIALRRTGKGSLAHFVVGVFAVSEATTIATSLSPDYMQRWPMIHYAGTAAIAAAIAGHGYWWFFRRPPPATPEGALA